MNTAISYNVYGENSDFALQAAIDETYRLEEMLSRFRPGSDISRINSSAGIKFEKVGTETFELLNKAKKISKCCNGLFDVTIGPLSLLWTEARASSEVPNGVDIKNALTLLSYKGLILNRLNKSVRLKKRGQSIDLGGIGKGFAADSVIDVLRKREIISAFVNLGGNVATLGAKPDSSPWRVGIRHPRREEKLIGAVSIINKSVVTSGDYQRFFSGGDGKKYHHILNPETGYPTESQLISATVVSDSSLIADALSTILFASSIENGIKALNSFAGTEAILIDDKLSLYITRGLVNLFEPYEKIEINLIN